MVPLLGAGRRAFAARALRASVKPGIFICSSSHFTLWGLIPLASFYQSSVSEFLSASEGEILARLSTEYARRGFTTQFTDQTLTWERDICYLRQALTDCMQKDLSAATWGLLLEFSIPRKEVRLDAVLLIGDQIVILEAKSGDAFLQARKQIEEYALLLHYFHKASDNRTIVPIIVSPEAGEPDLDPLKQDELFPQLAIYWVKRVITTAWQYLPDVLKIISSRKSSAQTDSQSWDESPYYPVPSIIEAAVALRSGLSIREIAHCEASEHEIGLVRQTIQSYVDQARANSEHFICFLTGVPGSGKTLVGLSLAHSHETQTNAIHFMSGNGPLVKVLQHLFTQESRHKGANAVNARIEARTLLENVHVFARNYMEDDQREPSNHAIIFDEAQRAWNRAQNKKKFNRDYSEPEMLLGIMERHHDWAAVIALVGGGQEINDGEAGLEEWGRALAKRATPWRIYASPEVLEGGPSTAGHRLFESPSPALKVQTNEALHLRTSNRSLRAENLASWVNLLLDGDATSAAAIHIADKFPVFLSRDLDETRAKLRQQAIGQIRYGLVGSSGASRLRAEGLEPSSTFHADYPWEHWYLAPEEDLRSSYRCEVFATEFEIQGLELDWIGLCWGGDFVWDRSQGWRLRKLLSGPNNRWVQIKNPERRNFRKNAYRVLLTRARQGMIIFLPKGNSVDSTNQPDEFDSTADFLLSCGIKLL
jgi:hypothetical protein